jgi:hypothetical protein
LGKWQTPTFWRRSGNEPASRGISVEEVASAATQLMNDADLIALYAKLYFHEREMREKITARLQTPLTLLVTLAGVFAFLFQRYDLDAAKLTAAPVMFAFFTVAALGALGFATFNLCQAWINNEYRFMPFAEQTARYRERLRETYASFPNAADLVNQYTHDYITAEYVGSSTFNAMVNDRRSNSIDKANQQIALTAAMLLIGFVAFQLGDLDRGKLRSHEGSVTKPVDNRIQR